MSNLTQTELTKVRKAALHSVTLSSDMKATVVDAKLKAISTSIKRILLRQDFKLEISALKVTD